MGGYDEEGIQWAAEDQELNFRVRRAGGRIWLDPTIRSQYFPRSTPTALWRQYRNYGVCKASTLDKHRTLPYWRPLVPAFMVAGSAVFAFSVVRADGVRWPPPCRCSSTPPARVRWPCGSLVSRVWLRIARSPHW